MHKVTKTTWSFSECQQQTLQQGLLHGGPEDIAVIFRADEGSEYMLAWEARGHTCQGQKWNWLNLSGSLCWPDNQHKMPDGDTLHNESLISEMITGVSGSLGKYLLSFQRGVFRPMICLREDKVGPYPVCENQHSPSLLQTALSLLLTGLVSQQLEGDLRGFSRRQKWQENHSPMQSELPAPEACTPQTRFSGRQSAVGIFTTSPPQQTWGRSLQSPYRGNHSLWQSRRGMSQTKPWMLPCELKIQVSYCLLSPWSKANMALQSISLPRFLLLSFCWSLVRTYIWFAPA